MSDNLSNSSNVDIIKGDPKKAINKIAIPMMLTLLVSTAYNLIDSVWVAGLGFNSLAAIGFFMPIYMIIVGISSGVGTGANSLISRYIGADDKINASNAAIHSIILIIILSILFPVVLLFFLKSILIFMGANGVIEDTWVYSSILVACTFSIVCPSVFSSILRAEGDIKRSTTPMVFSSILNIILDPILIYILHMGIAGAAWATVISSTISMIILAYWMFIKKDTYLSLNLMNYKTNWKIYSDILYVGIPTSFEMLVSSIVSISINWMLVFTAGATIVAAYTGAWRLISLGSIPLMGIGSGTVTVAGIAYGARNWDKLKESFDYSIKIGFIISVIITVILIIFAGIFSQIFTYTSSDMNSLVVISIQILSLTLILSQFAIIASCVLQGVGKGPTSLVLLIIRSLILVLFFAYLLGIILKLGFTGVYWGIVIGNGVGSLIASLYIYYYLKKLRKTNDFKNKRSLTKKG